MRWSWGVAGGTPHDGFCSGVNWTLTLERPLSPSAGIATPASTCAAGMVQVTILAFASGVTEALLSVQLSTHYLLILY